MTSKDEYDQVPEKKPDSLNQEDASPSQQQEEDKGEGEKKPARRGGGKRRRDTNKETEKNDDVNKKKSRVSKPLKKEEETEYFEEKRNLEDLWKAAFPVGTEFEKSDEFSWDFKHLEEALEEGGFLHGKKVYVSAYAEPQHKDQTCFVHVPTVLVIESTIEPSNKLALTWNQSGEEVTIAMKKMRMGWFPYIRLDERDRQVERTSSRIFTLRCNQRRAALRNMKQELVNKFEYFLPYYSPPHWEEIEFEHITEVCIWFPSDPPVICMFDWELETLDELSDQKIEEGMLSAERKNEFKEFGEEIVQAAKKAKREARDARTRAFERKSQETMDALKLYKFYPQNATDLATDMIKSPFINRYYGNAHQVL